MLFNRYFMKVDWVAPITSTTVLIHTQLDLVKTGLLSQASVHLQQLPSQFDILEVGIYQLLLTALHRLKLPQAVPNYDGKKKQKKMPGYISILKQDNFSKFFLFFFKSGICPYKIECLQFYRFRMVLQIVLIVVHDPPPLSDI